MLRLSFKKRQSSRHRTCALDVSHHRGLIIPDIVASKKETSFIFILQPLRRFIKNSNTYYFLSRTPSARVRFVVFCITFYAIIWL